MAIVATTLGVNDVAAFCNEVCNILSGDGLVCAPYRTSDLLKEFSQFRGGDDVRDERCAVSVAPGMPAATSETPPFGPIKSTRIPPGGIDFSGAFAEVRTFRNCFSSHVVCSLNRFVNLALIR
jgi:hypothetical protein